MRSRFVLSWVCHLLILSALILAGCATSQTPSVSSAVPEPTSTSVSPAASEAAAGPTSGAKAAAAPQAPATVRPTTRPLPPQPPRLLRRTPARGEELAPTASIVLRFDQAMDTNSLGKAFEIEPAVQGKLSWDDASTLRFAPQDGAFARAATYKVSVSTTARSASKLALVRPVEFTFRTVGYLEVTNVFPAPNSVEVASDTVIRVLFNRPVVPLTAIQDQGTLPQPLEFSPTVEGEGSWTNTSIYTFVPRELDAGTKYAVKVRAGLEDTTGGVLAEDFDWSFSTDVPRVVEVSPAMDAIHVSPNATIRVSFNQPMKPGPTQELFTLGPQGKAGVSGQFAWDNTTLIFTPTQSLQMGVTYEGRVAEGAPAATGEAAMARDVVWRFTVAAVPEALDLNRQGETDVELGSDLQITFSSPISIPTFAEGMLVTPTIQGSAWWDRDDTVAHIYGFFKPSTAYTITLTPKIMGRYGQPLAKSVTFGFRTAPYPPMVQLDVAAQVSSYNAYATPTISVSYRNISRLNLAIYAVSPEEFVALNRDDSWDAWQKFRPRQQNLVRRWSESVRPPLDIMRTYTATLTAAEVTLKAGLYYVEVDAPETKDPYRHLFVVSDTNLTLKAGSDQVLVWATDLRDGTPVSNVQLQVYSAKGKVVAEGETDRDGIFASKIPSQEYWAPLTVLGQRDDGVVVAIRNWSQGLSPYEFGLSYDPVVQKQRAFFYTDRLIYRPGQTVYYKGILRNDNDARYTLPTRGTRMSLSLIDSQGREVWRDMQTVSDYGTVYGEIVLGSEAGLGYYYLQATYNDLSFGTNFQVAEYRKPEFQVVVNLDKADYLQGETIQASVEASYFFGGPVSGAKVHWRVLRDLYQFDRWQGKDYYSFVDYGEDDSIKGFGEFVSEGEGQTDAQGRFSVKVPADLRERRQSYRYTIEMSVVDINNQEVSGRAFAIVHKGDFYIGVAPERYVGVAKEPQTIRLITVDTQGITRTQQALEVILYRHEWFSVKEQADDGAFYWTNKVRDTAVVTETTKTDDRGYAEVRLTPPDGGVYKVLAQGRDERENQVRSSVFFWVSDEAYINWGQQNHDRIELVADKKEYAPGDTAKILIPSPYQGPITALLTIERGGILEHRLLTLESNSEQLSLPITPDYAPNIYVSVVLVKGMDRENPVPGLKVGYVMLPVSAVQQVLTVKVTPSEGPSFKPRDEVVYDIETLDYRGQGVPADVSLQLVDLAVETLVGADTRDILQEFYRQRGLGVSTSATLVVSADRRLLERAAEGKGGGGAELAAGMVRELFPDTAFWAPAVRTDASGKARVTVRLPDNLTTWRMTAQAVTADTQVGKATVDIVTSLDIMVRPVVPRFLVVGDRPTLGAVLHNNTKEDLQMEVTLEADGLTLGTGKQVLQVSAQSRQVVQWFATVEAVEEATLRYAVKGGAFSDAIVWRLPVYHPSTPEVVGTAGEVEEQVVELVRLPQDVDTSLGELTVSLEPSLAAGMRKGLDYLEAYPYDCIEQTVSRFLPNIVNYRALQRLGVQNRELEVRLPQMVGVALQRLYTLQNLDGGWGWWANDDSSPTLTAYVLLGLAEAQRSTFVVDENVVDHAVSYLYTWLDERKPDTADQHNQQAMVLYALARLDSGDLGRTVALYEKRLDMAVYARAYLAMTLEMLAPDESQRLTTMVNELNDAAVLSATGAHWEEEVPDPWAMNTDVRTTAIVLRALVQLQPENALLPNAVRWLMTIRENGRWETTQENAWSVLALTDYMVSTGELSADYAYELAINGMEWASGTVTAQTVEQAVRAQVPVRDLRLGQDNDIVVARKAAEQEVSGKLYYSASLRYFLPADKVEALQRGIIVSRQYTLAQDPKTSITGASVNDTVVVTLTLIAPNDLHYLVLEDPLPAGAEAIDTSLQTTSQVAPEPGLVAKEKEESRRMGPGALGVWSWYWANHTEMRDEKVVLFATYLPKGTYQYSYALRCTTPGVFKVMPATAYEMYFADVFGRSAGQVFTVR